MRKCLKIRITWREFYILSKMGETRVWAGQKKLVPLVFSFNVGKHLPPKRLRGNKLYKATHAMVTFQMMRHMKGWLLLPFQEINAEVLSWQECCMTRTLKSDAVRTISFLHSWPSIKELKFCPRTPLYDLCLHHKLLPPKYYVCLSHCWKYTKKFN